MPEQVKTVFLDSDGNESRSPTPATVEMQIRYPDFDPIVVHNFHPDNEICAKWHGFKQKLGDKRAGKDGEEGYDQTMALFERLVESANWNLAREGAGPRTSILAAAIAHVLLDAGRITQADFDETVRDKQEECKDKTYREKAASNLEVIAHMDRIKVERTIERANKSKAAAAGVESSIDAL